MRGVVGKTCAIDSVMVEQRTVWLIWISRLSRESFQRLFIERTGRFDNRVSRTSLCRGALTTNGMMLLRGLAVLNVLTVSREGT